MERRAGSGRIRLEPSGRFAARVCVRAEREKASELENWMVFFSVFPLRSETPAGQDAEGG